MTDLSLRMLLFGEDRSASKVLAHVGEQAKRAAGMLAQMSRIGNGALGKLGKIPGGGLIAGLGIAGAGAALTGFGKKSVDAFQQTAAAARSTQRVIGGSIEDASRLNFSAGHVGIGTDQLTAAFGKFEKQLVSTTGKTHTITSTVKVATGEWKKHTATVRDAAGHFKTLTTMIPVEKLEKITRTVKGVNPALDQMGVNVRDANGRLLPMAQILPQVETAFSKMENGPRKTALAMSLFGKAGAGLLPLLNKGGEGIKKLGEESDKLGMTMGPNAIKTIAENKAAHRKLEDAMKSLEVTVGGVLMPVMTQLFTYFNTTAVPAIMGVAKWFKTDLVPVIKSASAVLGAHKGIVVGAVGALVALTAVVKVMSAVAKVQAAFMTAWTVATKVWAAATKVAAAAQWLFNAAMDASAVAKRAAFMLAWTIATKIWAAATKVGAAAQWLFNAAMDANPITLIIIGIAALAAGIVWLATKTTFFQTIWRGLKEAFNFVWSWIKGHWPLLLAILTGPVGLAVLAIVKNWDTIKSASAALWSEVRKGIALFVGVFLDMVGTVIHGAASAFGWIPGIGGPLKKAEKDFDSFRDGVVAAIAGTPKSFTFSARVSGIQSVIDGLGKIKDAGAFLKAARGVDAGVSGRGIAGLASGGQMMDGLTVVGEDGPELMNKSGSRVDVLSNAASRSRLAAGGGDTYIFRIASLDPAGAGRAVARALETHVGKGGTVRVAGGIR